MKIELNKIFLIFLPFAQALTINIFFPLKISEIVLAIIILFYFNKKAISLKTQYFIKNNKILWLLALFVTVSFLINVYWNYDYSPKLIPYRINRVGDSFIRLCYFYLCIIAYYISFKFISGNIKILKYWIYGSIVAAIYGWYVFISSGILHVSYIKLPGMEDAPQMLNGFVRSGTFKEGNYFGLFLILSAAISFYLNRTKTAFFLLFSLITSLSTVSIISGILMLIYIYRQVIKKKLYIIIPVSIVIFTVVSNTEYFKIYVYNKIFESSRTVTEGNYSKVERLITGRVAYYAGLDNPFFGVGPANYGLHYDHYNDYKKFVKGRSAYFENAMARRNLRAIPNNVYLEIWSEYGIISFFIFIGFLLKGLYISYKQRNDVITAGYVALIISLNAFPSFIMLFIWTFLAIPFAIRYRDLGKS